MSIGIDPTVDYVFHRLLGSPEYDDLTLHFLNALLNFEHPLVEVRYLDPFQGKRFADDKVSIFDVYASDEFGRRYNIEMQKTVPSGLRNRLIYYNSCMLIDQMREGDPYDALRPTISICLLDHVMFRKHDRWRSQFMWSDQHDHSVFSDLLQLFVLELPKFRLSDDNEYPTDPVARWMYFFCRAVEKSRDELLDLLGDPIFTQAIEVLEMIAKDPEERMLYERRLKAKRDAEACMDFAKKEAAQLGREEGLAEGLAEGRAEGLAEGLAEGRAEGHHQGQIEGRRQGELVGRIKLLGRLLNVPISPNIDSMQVQQLEATEAELVHQARARGLGI